MPDCRTVASEPYQARGKWSGRRAAAEYAFEHNKRITFKHFCTSAVGYRVTAVIMAE